jgi:hypothetical protein
MLLPLCCQPAELVVAAPEEASLAPLVIGQPLLLQPDPDRPQRLFDSFSLWQSG